MKIIGQRIRQLRTKHGMTQRELAGALNIGLSTIARWETIGIARNYGSVIKLSKFFNCTTDYLYGLKDE